MMRLFMKSLLDNVSEGSQTIVGKINLLMTLGGGGVGVWGLDANCYLLI